MDDLLDRRKRPFLVVAVVVGVIAVAVARLPDSFLSALDRNRPLSDAQADWAYRLLVLVAVAQAFYGGFITLRSERVVGSIERDPALKRAPRAALVALAARTGALMAGLTLAYGVAALWATGQRGGFWVFPLLAAAQALWYYREVGDVGRRLALKPPEPEPAPARWEPYDPNYSPPLARGATPRT